MHLVEPLLAIVARLAAISPGVRWDGGHAGCLVRDDS